MSEAPVPTLAPDPPVRDDGTCAVCGKPRTVPKGKYATTADFEADPFCSTKCARAWHDVQDRPYGELVDGAT